MSERFVVRWPHQGDKANPLGDEGQWLEDTASGEVVYGHQGEPEDMCLGRDLDAFVGRLNSVDDERRATVERAEKAETEVASLRRDVADLRNAMARVSLRTCDDGPCWCVVRIPHGEAHHLSCQNARAKYARTAPKGPEK